MNDIIIRYVSNQYRNCAFDVKIKSIVQSVYISQDNSVELGRIKCELLEALSLVENLEFKAKYPELIKETAPWNSLIG